MYDNAIFSPSKKEFRLLKGIFPIGALVSSAVQCVEFQGLRLIRFMGSLGFAVF